MAGNTEELIIQLQADLSDFRKQMSGMNDGIDNTAKQGSKSFGVLGKSVVLLGGAVLAASAGAVAMGVAFGKASLEAETALGKLQAQTGLTKEEAKELGKTAKNTFANGWGDSIGQVTSDLGILTAELGSVDEKTLESTQILKGISENADINGVSRALKSMTAAFPGTDQQKALDLITVGFQKTGDTSGDLLDTFNEYSPVMASMGMTAESFTNTLIAGSKGGARNLDVVADSLKEFNIRAKDGSKATAEGFSAIGLSAGVMGARIAKGGEDGQKAFQETLAALAKLENPIERNAAGVALFGTKFEDLEYKTIKAMGTAENYLGDFEGSTAKAGDALSDNIGTAWTTLWRNITTSDVGVSGITTFLKDLLIDFNAVVSYIKGTKDIKFLENAIPEGMFIAVTGIIDVFKTLQDAFMTVSNFVNGFFDLFRGDNIGAITHFSAATGLVGEEFVKFWDKVKPLKAIFDELKLVFTSLATTFLEISSAVMPPLMDFFAFLGETIGTVLLPIISDAVVFIKEILGQMTAFWTENGTDIITAVTNAFNIIKGIIEFIMPAISFIISVVWDTIKSVIQAALDVIMGAVKIFTGLFTGDWGKMWEGIKQVFSGAITLLLTYFTGGFIGKMLGKLGGFVVQFGKKMGAGFKGAFNSAVTWMKSLVETVTLKIMYLIDDAAKWGKDLISKFVSGISSVIGTVGTTIGKVVTAITSPILKLPQTLLGYGKNIVQGLWNGISNFNLGSKVTSWVTKNIPGTIKKALGIASPSKLMKKFGSWTSEGLALGIFSQSKKVTDSMKDMAKNVIKPAETMNKEINGIISGMALGNTNLNGDIGVKINKPDMEQALKSANYTAKATIKQQQEKEMKVELTLKGGIDKLADMIEARVVSKVASSIGGRL